MKFSIVILCLLLGACGPSCEERGGSLVQTGWYTWTQFIQIGTSLFPVIHNDPIFECIGATK